VDPTIDLSMIILETALNVVRDPDAFIHGDVIEAYQYINDTGNVDLLSEEQKGVLRYYIETGLVDSPVIEWNKNEI